MGIHDLWIFVLAGLLLNMTPGPDMALVIARSTQHGARAGIVAAFGIGAGLFVHIFAAAIGISAIVVASAAAFAVLKWIGAVYLIYLGARMLLCSRRTPPSVEALHSQPTATLRRVFMQGFLTNVLNPKIALFFLAFLPQFVDPNAPSKATACVLLGVLFNVVGTMWNVAVALLAGVLANSKRYTRVQIWLEQAVGALFVGVGVKLALTERQ